MFHKTLRPVFWFLSPFIYFRFFVMTQKTYTNNKLSTTSYISLHIDNFDEYSDVKFDVCTSNNNRYDQKSFHEVLNNFSYGTYFGHIFLIIRDRFINLIMTHFQIYIYFKYTKYSIYRIRVVARAAFLEHSLGNLVSFCIFEKL